MKAMNDKRFSWIQFYPRDWISDMDLRRCSLAARGLWMEMICLMTQGRDFGRLVDGAGVKPTVKQLAEDARITEQECETLLAELRSRSVFSEDADGVIYSRRMVREFEVRQRNAANGAKGGNPSLIKSSNSENRDKRLETKARLTDTVKPSVIQLIQKHPYKSQLLHTTWAEWVEYRMALKKCKAWEAMFAKQVEMLSKHSAIDAIQILNTSMQNGWMGIFESSLNNAAQTRKPRELNI
jgi:hypothetical protein